MYNTVSHNLIISMLQDQEVDQDVDLLVLASDGLWDVVPNEVIHFNNIIYILVIPTVSF